MNIRFKILKYIIKFSIEKTQIRPQVEAPILHESGDPRVIADGPYKGYWKNNKKLDDYATKLEKETT